MGDGRVRLAAAALAVAVTTAVAATAGCGVRPTGIVGAGDPVMADGNAGTVTVYLVQGERLRPVVRPELPGHPYLALSQLSVPVTSGERRQGLHTEVHHPLEARLMHVGPEARDDGMLVVDLASTVPREPVRWSRAALAQIACTAKALPGVGSVRLWSAPGSDRYGWGPVQCADRVDERAR